MIWGGVSTTSGEQNDGAIFNPRTGRWSVMPASPLSPRDDASVVWTGHVAIIWGGCLCTNLEGGALDNGASYNPVTRKWKLLPASPLSPRYSASAFWTGNVAIFIGGRAATSMPSPFTAPIDGATYNPGTGTWHRLPALPKKGAGSPVWITAAWSGHHLVTWTTFQIIKRLQPNGASIRGRQQGAEWSPGQTAWRPLPKPPPHIFTNGATSLWVDGHDVLIGGSLCLPAMDCIAALEGSAENFNPVTATWSSSPMNPVIDGDNPMTSTGSSAVIVDVSSTVAGGNLVLGDSVAYSPGTNTVVALPQAPDIATAAVSLVWTGRDVLLWGTDGPPDGTVALELS
jgi:hypothetical protein